MAIQIAQDPIADKVLTEDDFALLAGMLLDQHIAYPCNGTGDRATTRR